MFAADARHFGDGPGLPAANWAGNIRFGAARTARPASVAELCEVVAAADRVRVLGTGHSFNPIADTDGTQVSVAGLPRTVEIDRDAGTVTVAGGLRFGEFTDELHRAGLALRNLGSLPHISVAGACATGTHGSGVGNGTIASTVRALELVTAGGELRTFRRGEADFPGTVVALGALGVVTRLTLDVVPAFDVQQWVYEDLPHDLLRAHFEEVMSAAYSVSLFTSWTGDRVEQVWLKQRVPASGPVAGIEPWPRAVRADGPRHMIPGVSPEHCTDQTGLAGPWFSRLPHFRMEFTPSNGEELQSEYFVARADAVAAFEALDAVRERIAPRLLVGEIRTVAADDLWLSPAHGRDTVAFHFTWLPGEAEVRPALEAVEAALAPFDVRPHWGKVFAAGPEAVRAAYPRLREFAALAERLDPAGTFRNAWLDALWPTAP
ncbi:FAD-binding protein [Streptomyces sp. NPDC059740]|uniref:FAD-binding protein n=1 Tax=Streptomyces sp. NPDC059740 TaxID=3346926 RepID=UPI003654C34C